ncbi:putative membrane protein [Lachnospiraceae bacterium PM6-15]|uniref:ECF transporter S component n=1 Tax=Ohessyouella blattaphilus TaxID=2949333 RepID=A0ABT1EH24_9FIRM|nr:ECF transporter S component [Ohessyouella blattaphilus]MCP1109978.1 ECF transporter S component [Ohessyouella blattaphilus]MCR8563372.1 ECF transporter S component [Ohessyouella blattaphilus]MDL2250965.1 ECF transporter S component [Lachnospiraceae bacterium OttesenSCG-928-J05]
MENIKNVTSNHHSTESLKTMALTGMLVAITLVMINTPLGRITLPIVSVTIAHIPILIATLCLGLGSGLIVALVFGMASLFIALTSPASILDPFFVNPLVSILPRLLIPVTTYGVIKLCQLIGKKKRATIYNILAIIVGNLTNTFGVYLMLYLIYAKAILEKSGTPAITLIITAISTSTLFKCIIVVLITTPIVAIISKQIKK